MYLWLIHGETWQYIQHIIEQKLKKEIKSKYKNVDNKLNRLIREQTKTPT